MKNLILIIYSDYLRKSNISSTTKLSLVKTEHYTIDGLEFTQCYYRPLKKGQKDPKNSALISGERSYSSIRPEEGDFRVTVGRGELQGKDWFRDASDDTITITNSYMLYEKAYTIARYGAYIVSNTLKNLFVNKAIDFIEDGHKGKGNVYTRERRVYKWGEIYTKGKWKDYYSGYQDEIYWAQIIDIYSTDEDNYGEQIYSTQKIYEPYRGYNPIFVRYNKRFRDDNEIYEIAKKQYDHDGYIYRDYGSSSISTKKWTEGIKLSYPDDDDK